VPNRHFTRRLNLSPERVVDDICQNLRHRKFVEIANDSDKRMEGYYRKRQNKKDIDKHL